jgi:CRISPR/Cas system-associated exonuclease Cas4 (RecB family)
MTYKQIPSWSFSSLMDYEACPHKAWHKSINKSPRPPYEENRGTKLHTKIENYMAGAPPDLDEIHPNALARLIDIRLQRDRDTYAVEEEWGFDKNWENTNYKDAWLKAKTDFFQFHGHTEIWIEDWKSGKSEGNELKHIMQGQLYALCAVHKFPAVTKVVCTFHYLDEGKIRANLYNREIIMSWKPKWHNRAKIMTEALTFPPKANKANCRFCMFGPQGSDVCEYGIPSP